MIERYTARNRAERLIAVGRVVLAAASLFAVWLDPTQPAKYAGIAYGLLVAYVVYAALLAPIVVRAPSLPRGWRISTHVFDLAFFSTFIYFTAGPSSPFIAYFVFSVVCGTLRWGWRGALWTACASLATFLGLGIYFAYVLSDPAFDLNPFIIFSVYLAVVAALLGYLGAHEERSRREISQLSDWPREDASDVVPLVREVSMQARLVVGAPAVVLAWTEREEPRVNLALQRGDDFELERLAPEQVSPIVAEGLERDAFLGMGLRSPGTTVLAWGGDRTTRWPRSPIHPEIVRRSGLESALAAPLPGETVTGWIFFPHRGRATADHLEIVRIVAGIVASRLDLHYLLRRLRDAAATEERIKLARDLHDGVMQSFTGIALRLAVLERQIFEEPARALASIAETRQLIALEQQDLRFFIEDLGPAPPGAERGDLRRRLADLVARVETEWNLDVDLRTAETSEAVPPAMTREVYLIVREALINAARHGAATRVSVTAAHSADGQLSVDIVDNGRGFPFHGAFTHEELRAKGWGPRSIRERVSGLSGALSLQSSEAGSRVSVLLPVSAKGS